MNIEKYEPVELDDNALDDVIGGHNGKVTKAVPFPGPEPFNYCQQAVLDQRYVP